MATTNHVEQHPKKLKQRSATTYQSWFIAAARTLRDALSHHLYLLSAVWWILCSILVYKHPPLLIVFASFMTCWILAAAVVAALLLWWLPLVRHHRHRTSQRDGCSNIKMATSGHDAWCIYYTYLNAAPMIRSFIGLLACLVQGHFLTLTAHGLFVAVGIAAGYLAFELWFSSTFLRDEWKTTTLLGIVQQAVTLSLFLVWLVHSVSSSNSNRNDHGTLNAAKSSSSSSSLSVWSVMCVWTLYKTVCLAQTTLVWYESIVQPQQEQHQAVPQTVETTVPQHATSLVASASTCTSMSTRATTAAPPTRELLWRIHGVDYDLTDYVERHPGGREAILLGQGRDDCTALFQSYHPFTIAHAQSVLAKYRVVDRRNGVSGVGEKASSAATRRGSNTTASIVPIPSSPHYKHAVPNNPVGQRDDQRQRDAVNKAFAASIAHIAHENDAFYNILCQRVANALLKEYQFHPVLDRAASWYRVAYYAVVVSMVLVSGMAHARGSSILFGSFSLAVWGWLLGALGHDAGHFCASRRYPWLNDIGVWAMSFLCNPILWQHQHTFGHHSHTNELHGDPDLYHFGTLLRVHRRFQQQAIYKYQSNPLFVALAYTMVVFGTCFWIPWGLIQDGSLYGVVAWTDRQRPLRTAGLYLHLFGYAAFIMVLPFWVHASWQSALAAVAIHVATSGLIFAIFSQINHLNEASLDPDQWHKRRLLRQQRQGADTAKLQPLNLNESWAVQQIETSNNFCPDSIVWHYLSNGLNLQIEHHLFPGLNHCHLHRIQPTVQAVCEEYGILYKSYDSWSAVMQATLDWLDRLAVEPELKVKE